MLFKNDSKLDKLIKLNVVNCMLHQVFQIVSIVCFLLIAQVI